MGKSENVENLGQTLNTINSIQIMMQRSINSIQKFMLKLFNYFCYTISFYRIYVFVYTYI